MKMESSIIEIVEPLLASGAIAERAFEALKEGGVPGRCEDYRFTNCQELIMENGLSTESIELELEDSSDVVICSLTEFKAKYSEVFDRYYGSLTSKRYGLAKPESIFTQKNNLHGGMVALSDATTSEGSVIYIKRGGEFRGEIYGMGRLLVIAERYAKAEITLLYEDSDNLANSVAEIFLSDGAEVATLQDMHALTTTTINTILVECNRDARYKNVASTIGCTAVRNNIIVDMNESGADTQLFGVNIADKNQVSDHYTLINHNKPYCTSDELYKNIVADSSTVSFQGNIYVKKGADGTSAEQLSRNLILDATARAYSKPHLEIYADEVKCTHAATTGQMDSEALFYIMQRGVSKELAHRLQVYGFAADVLNHIDSEATKERLMNYIEEAL